MNKPKRTKEWYLFPKRKNLSFFLWITKIILHNVQILYFIWDPNITMMFVLYTTQFDFRSICYVSYTLLNSKVISGDMKSVSNISIINFNKYGTYLNSEYYLVLPNYEVFSVCLHVLVLNNFIIEFLSMKDYSSYWRNIDNPKLQFFSVKLLQNFSSYRWKIMVW